MMGYPAGAPRKMWFADIDEDAADGSYPWQPCLQLDGWITRATTWFATRAECEEFIRDHLVGAGWMDGPTRYPCPDCGVEADDWCVNLATGERRLTVHAERLRYQFKGWPS